MTITTHEKEQAGSSINVSVRRPANRGTYSIRDIAGILIVVAILASLTNFLYFASYRSFFSVDSYEYLANARNLVAGRGFVGINGHSETIRTPGYPIVIAGFLWLGIDLKYLVLLQHLVQVLVAVVTTACAYWLSGSRWQAWVAGIVLCIDLPMLSAANSILTETMFVTVLCIILWLLWYVAKPLPHVGKISALAGFLSGTSVLIRPVSLFFFFPVALYLWLVRSTARPRTITAFLLGFAVLPLFWSARNYRETHFFGVTSIAGRETLSFRAAGALAAEDPGDFDTNFRRRREELEQQSCKDLMVRYGADCASIPYEVKASYNTRLGKSILMQHPIGHIKLMLRGMAVAMLGDDAARMAEITGLSPGFLNKFLLLYTFPTLVLAILGLTRLWTSNRDLFWLIGLTIAYFIVLPAGAEAYSRYRVPIVPIYAILIGVGFDFLLRYFAGKKNSQVNSASLGATEA